jgi:hypothetical protein
MQAVLVLMAGWAAASHASSATAVSADCGPIMCLGGALPAAPMLFCTRMCGKLATAAQCAPQRHPGGCQLPLIWRRGARWQQREAHWAAGSPGGLSCLWCMTHCPSPPHC